MRARISGGFDTLRIAYRGGWSIMPAQLVGPAPGARSRQPRVLSERMVDGAYTVTLEGLAGQRDLFLFSPPDPDGPQRPQIRATGGASATYGRPSIGSRTGFLDVTFPSAGANADGFTTTQLSITRGTP